MISPRQVRGTVVTVLLCSALAGCGTVVAGTQAAAPAAPATPAVGCASVNQATSVTVHRTMHLVEPTRAGVLTKTQSKPELVRALFGEFCDAVANASKLKGVVNCPAAFGIAYTGTFYDGTRPLARFVYGPSGCQTVSVTAAGQTRFAALVGVASGAIPRLETDMAAVLGVPKSQLVVPPMMHVNPGGPNKPLR